MLPSFFDDDFSSLMDWSHFNESNSGMDIYETDDSVIVEAQVPGINEDNVEVSVEGNILTINARQEENEEDKRAKKTIHKSTRQTSFSYTASLPRMVASERAHAVVENGVVKVTIPKSENERPRKITVTKK